MDLIFDTVPFKQFLLPMKKLHFLFLIAIIFAINSLKKQLK
jgi:hypothetical protein